MKIASERKDINYNALLDSYTFIPLALEIFGPINNIAHTFLSY